MAHGFRQRLKKYDLFSRCERIAASFRPRRPSRSLSPFALSSSTSFSSSSSSSLSSDLSWKELEKLGKEIQIACEKDKQEISNVDVLMKLT